MKRCLFLFVAFSSVILGCVSAPDEFLLRKLDGQDKAKVLVDQGIEQYQLQLVRREDYGKVSDVREYFSMALRYDPDNLLAIQYRKLVDSFKATRLQAKLKEASGYLAKPKRREAEDYAICMDVQAAARLDPTNAAVVKLQRDITPLRTNLLNSYISRAKASLGKITRDTPPTAREANSIDAYQNLSKAVAIDPQNSVATEQMRSLREELAKIFSRHVDNANKLIAGGKFDEANAEIAVLSDLNKKLGGGFDSKVRSTRYSLNYQWARSFFARKDYLKADAKVSAALSITKTDEALALKKKISDIAGQAEQEASFDASLGDIDSLISAGELVSANARINAVAKTTSDQSKLDQLDSRRQTIAASLKDIYAKAVDSYRNEDFKDAIELFQSIVQIDVDYEQAADYLEKAKAKQKLIEEY
jgi:hypothetical protein